jgi:molecular chaperone DnaK
MIKKKIGIDLGTTTTALAEQQIHVQSEVPTGVMRKVRLEGLETAMLDSVAWFSPDHDRNPKVGYRAKEEGPVDPKGVIARDVKRDMGKVVEKRGMTYLEFDSVNYTPEKISSYYLENVILGSGVKPEEIDRLTVTVPASFTNEQRISTLAAVEQAVVRLGMDLPSENISLLSEPLAAWISYLSEQFKSASDSGSNYFDIDFRSGSEILVYDLGGGTLDLTLLKVSLDQGASVEYDNVKCKILNIGRYNAVGGTDCDKLIALDLLRRFEINHPDFSMAKISKQEAQSIKSILLNYGEKIKLAINEAYTDEDDEVDFPQGVRLDVGGNRYEIEAEYALDEALGLLDSLMKGPGAQFFKPVFDLLELDPEDYDPSDIPENILLIGGMTEFSYVQDQVKEIFGRRPLVTPQPQYAVARGAAIYSELKSRGSEEYSEFAADSYYVWTKSGFKKILGRDSIGGEEIESVHKLASATDAFDLKIFAGEDTKFEHLSVDKLSSLVSQGVTTITLDKPYPKGTDVILVMRFDDNKIPSIKILVESALVRDWCKLGDLGSE